MEQQVAQTISKTPPEEPSEDFELLVKQGIDLIQKLTGHIWTDFNLHDPGVTILEQLCIAITDLSYRCGFSIRDILTNTQGEIIRTDQAFFDNREVLCTNPVNINDFRKIILDKIDEIDNVEIVPLTSQYAANYLKRLYTLRIRVNDTVADRFEKEPGIEELIKQKVRDIFLSVRNIGEDIAGDIVILRPVPINIFAEIKVNEFIPPEEILLDIYRKLQDYLSPKVRFYSEAELRERGMQTNEIYDGPFLDHGFMPDKELKPMISEIDALVMSEVIATAKGVQGVMKIGVTEQKEGEINKPFILDNDSFPWLQASTFPDNIKLFVGEYKLNFEKRDFVNASNKLKYYKQYQNGSTLHESFNEVIKGVYRDISDYISIQNSFPHIFGIGELGLYSYEREERQGRVKQLKAYLLFYEQILANFLGQLSSVSKFLSTDIEEGNERSYYHVPLYNVPKIADILAPHSDGDGWTRFKENEENEYIKSLKEDQENITIYRKRKHLAYEHLYGRFNKKFQIYPLLAYIRTYGDDKNSKTGLLLKWKADVLRNLARTEYNRVKSFNYIKNEGKVSGFEEKIKKLLYIKDGSQKKLCKVFEGPNVTIVPTGGNSHHSAESVKRKVTWDDEEIEIIENIDNPGDQEYPGKPTDREISQKNAYFFRKEGISLLKYGIRPENYKIGPCVYCENDYVIAYKSPSAEVWEVISKHPTKNDAIAARDKLINFLMELSIQSEGFHMVEHILLRPNVHTNHFGFRYYKNEGSPVFMNRNWTSFSARESRIEEIVGVADSKKDIPDEWIKLHSSYQKRQTDNKHGLSVNAEIAGFRQNATRFYPRFEMLLKTTKGQILDEDFYNSRITFVLPLWPARFQEPEFRSFVEDLIKNCAPAGFHIQFLWLGIKKMHEFEEIYFNWLTALQNGNSLIEISEKLAWTIGAERFLVRSF